MSLDELYKAARTGDRRAREALASAVYDLLWPRFRRSFSLDEAEDLVQTTMVAIFRKIDQDRDPLRSFERFVFVTAVRVTLMARRSWAREQRRRVTDPPTPGSMVALETSVSERFARVERLAWVIAALDELDTGEQRTLAGWVSEADWRSRAAVEGVARPTLRSRVHRILAKLRQQVQRQEAGAAEPEPTPT